MKLMLPFVVSDQLLSDILITAVEGGSDYWAYYSEVKRDAELNILSVRVTEQADHDVNQEVVTKVVTPHDLAAAIESLASRVATAGFPYRHIQSVINEDVDAETADVILQLAVLGEVIYG